MHHPTVSRMHLHNGIVISQFVVLFLVFDIEDCFHIIIYIYIKCNNRAAKFHKKYGVRL